MRPGCLINQSAITRGLTRVGPSFIKFHEALAGFNCQRLLLTVRSLETIVAFDEHWLGFRVMPLSRQTLAQRAFRSRDGPVAILYGTLSQSKCVAQIALCFDGPSRLGQNLSQHRPRRSKIRTFFGKRSLLNL